MKMKIKQIKELSETDVRGAKNELAEYAEKEFNINLRKNKSLDNMLIDLEDELLKVEGVEGVEDQPTETIKVQDEQEDNQKDVQEIKEVKHEPKAKHASPKKLDLHVFTGYLTVPYWIVDWIQETKGWKDKKCPWKGSEKIINTILYHISKDGQIEIRETRNSKFITLT